MNGQIYICKRERVKDEKVKRGRVKRSNGEEAQSERGNMRQVKGMKRETVK